MMVNNAVRRVSYVFLCTVPFLDFVLVGARALRIPVLYQAVGGALFAVIVIAAWLLGARVIGSGVEEGRRLALAGGLLITPWAVVSLLWVGLGTPWDATSAERRGCMSRLLSEAA